MIKYEEHTLRDNLLSWHPITRFISGAIGVAFIGHYVPRLCFAIVGVGINTLTWWFDVLVGVSILIIATGIGYWLRRIWAVAMACIGLIFMYELSLIIREPIPEGFKWILINLTPLLSLILNAYVFSKYQKFVKLER